MSKLNIKGSEREKVCVYVYVRIEVRGTGGWKQRTNREENRSKSTLQIRGRE